MKKLLWNCPDVTLTTRMQSQINQGQRSRRQSAHSCIWLPHLGRRLIKHLFIYFFIRYQRVKAEQLHLQLKCIYFMWTLFFCQIIVILISHSCDSHIPDTQHSNEDETTFHYFSFFVSAACSLNDYHFTGEVLLFYCSSCKFIYNSPYGYQGLKTLVWQPCAMQCDDWFTVQNHLNLISGKCKSNLKMHFR